ncbi:cryptochrome/photolyase family protein [Klenkia terrae]
MSAHLHLGTVHPRTLLHDIARSGLTGPGVDTYVSELCWREFYADVLWHRPETAREYYNPELQGITYSTGQGAEEDFEAWAQGRTGFPIVDAGMRQLLAQGWMHNRLRMIVGSFLVKDLHQEWTTGARYFMQHLVDGDLASNNHGWQWVAGTGTDASPYYRVFNPTTQGKKFDPDGGYVKRWVPELRDLDAKHVHEPWTAPGGVPDGYPEPIVDHAHERQVALDRYQAAKGR